MLCGAAAGLSQSIVSSPMELIKTRVQLQTEACTTTKSMSCAATSSSTVTNCSSYASPMDCVRKIVTTEGWRGIFRGQLITVCRDVSVTFAACHSRTHYFARVLSTPSCFSLSFLVYTHCFRRYCHC